MKTLYTGRATSVAGRAGHTQTDDGKIAFDLSPPGGDGTGTNPEQLFACAYSACFGSAIDAVAKKKQMTITAITVSADVILHQEEGEGFFLSVILDAALEGVEDSVARGMIVAAHQVCPYSKATRGNIKVILKANGQMIDVKAAV